MNKASFKIEIVSFQSSGLYAILVWKTVKKVNTHIQAPSMHQLFLIHLLFLFNISILSFFTLILFPNSATRAHSHQHILCPSSSPPPPPSQISDEWTCLCSVSYRLSTQQAGRRSKHYLLNKDHILISTTKSIQSKIQSKISLQENIIRSLPILHPAPLFRNKGWRSLVFCCQTSVVTT